MPLDLYDEFLALLDALDADGVEYAVVGAMALAIHGAPRATEDIDLLVRPDDLHTALAAAARCGFDIPAIPMTFSDSGLTIQRVTRAEPGGLLTLDLILVASSLEEIWETRQRFDLAGRSISAVSRDGLVRMKSMSGRLQDLADIERLRGNGDG